MFANNFTVSIDIKPVFQKNPAHMNIYNSFIYVSKLKITSISLS